ncbi:MAG: hypothetical protein ACRD3C_04460 [Vicinamibacterales bacterium]
MLEGTHPPPFELPIDVLPLPAVWLDVSGVIIGANRRFQKVFGRLPSLEAGNDFLDMVFEPDRVVLWRALDSVSCARPSAVRRRKIRLMLPGLGPFRCDIRLAAVPTAREDCVLAFVQPLPPRSVASPKTVSRGLRPERVIHTPLLMSFVQELRGPLRAIRERVAHIQSESALEDNVRGAAEAIERGVTSLGAVIDDILVALE